MKKIIVLALVLILLGTNASKACTNFLITKGATVDGSVIVTYAADSHQLYGALYYWAAADWKEGSMLDIYEWDTGKYLGQIKQVPHTYQVIGNMNEHQVIIGETTYGGLSELHHQKDAIVDYGSLIYIALQRAKTAREAIKVMTDLVAEYGYASEGESFSVADKNEVWILEMIGKGEYEKGAVWVALRIPDGYVSAHANQARITTFEFQKENKWDDPNATVFNSPDVISFAKKHKFYKGADKDFSFSDVYAPVDFGGARFCELRVWSFFKAINKDFAAKKSYLEYSLGNIKHKIEHKEGKPYTPANFASNRMPLWIKPDHKLEVHEIMNRMRDHLEGTEYDMSKDVGAEPFGIPYRWRPLIWKLDGKEYCNERVTATQQTGFSFIAQARSWLPDHIGGLFWFGVDDAASCVYTPVYMGSTRVPETYAEETASMIRWNDNAAFWVFNQVSNLAYTRYNLIHPEINEYQQKLEDNFIAYTPVIDQAAKTLYDKNPQLARDFLTDYTVNTANELVYKWRKFYQYLFMKYMDGNVKNSKGHRLISNGNKGEIPLLTQPGYSEKYYRKVVEETGDKFLVK